MSRLFRLTFLLLVLLVFTGGVANVTVDNNTNIQRKADIDKRQMNFHKTLNTLWTLHPDCLRALHAEAGHGHIRQHDNYVSDSLYLPTITRLAVDCDKPWSYMKIVFRN